MTTPRHSVSVAGVVVREDGRILAIQRADNGTWEPPGGVLELDESPQAGTRREVQEETGLLVQVEQLTGVYKNMARGVVSLVFRCSPVGGSEQTSAESQAVSWLTPDEARERMNATFAIRVLDALSADGPYVRTHDGQKLIAAE
ncbi:NUDIX hydrolase [Streptomyces sp. Ru73]|uniref:NUDIX hydrolase n=1 Tax=Streptomyces sp. Ru73 TaxID=2080748 RepID=UPI000CDE5422|nr:NUDIX domain-containing protein [Streptomyces sp. Ru73]POX41346.1 NUDIX hydrolase [Streptomyces sp. Ru73]